MEEIPDYEVLETTAAQVVGRTIAALPPELRHRAALVSVRFLPVPELDERGDPVDDGECDLLGMFVGRAAHDTESPDLPPAILLFLDNLWFFAAEEGTGFEEEVRVTYLHELGHYLGLDEDEVAARGLA